MDLPKGVERALVPVADEALHPETCQNLGQTVQGNRPGRIRHGPKHPNRERDERHRLEGSREGRPQVGELFGKEHPGVLQSGIQILQETGQL